MNNSDFAGICLAVMLLASSVAQAVDVDGAKAVLVTGASSGIGRAVAERLAAAGHTVYAGARNDKDINELNAIENIIAVRLDVTSQEDVDAAVKFVKSKGKGLYAIVNNAGVAYLGSLLEVPMDDLNQQFGVNVYGVFRVTKAFAPLVIEQRGRITTTGSIAGFVAGPNSGVYSMTKFALEAYTDSLAAELDPRGVKVSIIEPGAFKTSIWQKTAEHYLEGKSADGVEVTENQRRQADELIAYGDAQPEPYAVAEAVVDALFADSPRRRYLVAPDQRQATSALTHAIRRVAELNSGHNYSLTRAELEEILDVARGAP
jgi:NAD(P)-dependent dehydrogenase (short-subunit alcohol dehydrogenase family)